MKISDFCTYAPKSPIKAGEAVADGEYMFFTSSADENKRYSNYQLDCEGIIMGTGGNATLHYYNGKFATSTDCVVLLPNEDIRCKYLYYFFLCNIAVLEEGFKGAGLKHTNKNYINSIELPNVPPIEEQDKVIEVLDKIQTVVSGRTTELSKLDELVKARFVEMFGLPGIDAKGWGLRFLNECCELNPKKSSDIRLASGLEVSFVPMPAVTENGGIDTSEIKLYDEVKNGFTYFAENDVLFAKITPCMENGKGAVAVGLRNGIGFGSTEFHVLRPIVERSNPYWLYTLTAFDIFRKDAAANMTGSAGQRRVPARFLENYKVTLPPIELQDEFATFVEQINKSKFVVQQALDKAQTLFDSLMQQYFG